MLLKKLLATARYAPSGINLQPVSWKAISSTEKVQELAESILNWMKTLIAQEHPLAKTFRMERHVTAWEKGEDRICRQAPQVIIAYGLKDNPTAASAATIALTYLDLIAVSYGLGACWGGYIQFAANTDILVKKHLGLRSRENCYGAMLLGYPQHKYSRIPLRNPARITWL